jgi:hypothetical protein
MVKDKKSFENICRLNKSFQNYDEIMKRHRRAVRNKENFYIDPETGFNVFTALALFTKGNCCRSGCRHCPFIN